MTLSTQFVLQVLVAEPAREMYGLEICEAAGLASGTVHPILARLEVVGWLESHWEERDPRAMGRPRRRYYRLTPDGAQRALAALARTRSSAGLLHRINPEVAGGTS
ncbi:helix-turn-helix transcriptional regulator [Pseudonocardia eucalypti]